MRGKTWDTTIDVYVDGNNQTLLTWRQAGQSYDQGWHVPGGIVRYKEKISNSNTHLDKKKIWNERFQLFLFLAFMDAASLAFASFSA